MIEPGISLEFEGIFPTTKEERCQKSELLALIDEIQVRREHLGESKIVRLDDFKAQLLTLANAYRTWLMRREEEEEFQAQFSKIVLAAQVLKTALGRLDSRSRKRLGKAQVDLFHHADGADKEELSRLEDLHRVGYEPRTGWHFDEDIDSVEVAAASLAGKNKRGRPSGTLEQQVAQEFVVLCHQHSWSPIRVSNSGSIRNTGVVLSDPVRCLATVFQIAGLPKPVSSSKALSALNVVRKGFSYATDPVCADHGRMIYDDEFCDFYRVDFLNMVLDSDMAMMAMPRFGPGTKT